jgi:hypothetical protein
MTTRQPDRSVSRRTALAGLGAGGLALAARGAVAQDASTERAGHPIVGAWLTISQPPPAIPSIFAADGTVTIAYPPNYVDPTLGLTFQGPMLGAWEPISERGIHFSAIQALTDADGTYVGTFTLEGHPLVDADGQTFSDNTPDARVILRDATNAILSEATLAAGVVAVRITPGSLIFPEGTPVAATPAP